MSDKLNKALQLIGFEGIIERNYDDESKERVKKLMEDNNVDIYEQILFLAEIVTVMQNGIIKMLGDPEIIGPISEEEYEMVPEDIFNEIMKEMSTIDD